MSTPMREDEVTLWDSFGDHDSGYTNPRDAGDALGIHPRRVEYLCQKWARQRRYDYGVAADLGWKITATDTRPTR